jgi:hypothetical protein
MISKKLHRHAIKVIRISIGAIACSWIYGCVVTTNLVSSASIEQGQGRIDKVGRLEIGGTVIVIRPDNHIYAGTKERVVIPSSGEQKTSKDYRFSPFYYKDTSLDTHESFIVEVLIATGDHEVSFSPMALMLQSEKAKKSYPLSFYKLAPTYSTTMHLNPVTPLCRHPQKKMMYRDYPISQYQDKSREQLHLTKDQLYCFAVQFDIPPVDPRHVFTITVNDISVDGQKLSMPVITYLPDTYEEKLH